MIRFIWQNWWRKKERFILLIFGALIISVGLSYLVGLSHTNQTTIVDELQQRWTASYDIVVRPEGTRSITEEENLLDPNYLSGLTGGISIEQYEQIKAMADIEIAAPIAMIGYLIYPINLDELKLEENGIYRLVTEEINNNGINETRDTHTTYFTHGNNQIIEEKFRETNGFYFMGFPYETYNTTRTVLLAAIDPEQEAKLVGLDESIVKIGSSRYFNKNDVSENILINEDAEETGQPEIYRSSIPVIISNQTFTDVTVNFALEKLDLPYDDSETARATLDMLENNGGKDYLDKLNGNTIQTFSYTEGEIHALMVNSLSGYNKETGEPFMENRLPYQDLPLVYKPGELVYKSVLSPFPERWPYAYELETFTYEGDIEIEGFRKQIEYDSSNGGQHLVIKPNWIGSYDPSKLNIAKDPTNELPMETYRPATAELVLDAHLNPINPPEVLNPEVNPNSFLGNPPTMLTTMEAAEKIVGDQPISAIRIKVAGVEDLTEESQQKLERKAAEIEEKTGLITDITLGSSPQPTLTHVPAINDEEALGWFQQPWIKIGSSMTIFKEAKIGYSGIILSIIAVAVIYVWASNLVSLLARRQEFAVLLAVGWRPNQLSKLLYLESAILGTMVALISWIMLGLVYVTEETNISILRFLLTGLFGLIIYLLGAIIPAILVQKISPYESIRTGEISTLSKRVLKTRGIFSMSFNHFIGKWKRSLLSIFAIAMPTSLLALFLYITFRLQGVMYTTWLGQYVALEVGPVQYTAMVVALIIAILTTAEIMWQNVSERMKEIALLKAIGWRNKNIRMLIWSEGLITGIWAAILALAAALAMLWFMYDQLPINEMGYILLTGSIPILVGVIGSILPAERAVKISPVNGLAGIYSNLKVTQKRMKRIVLTTLTILIGLFIYLLFEILIN